MLRSNYLAAKFLELTPAAIPTILGYDYSSKEFVIGEPARSIAKTRQPVVQNFKLFVAEGDLLFQGRSVLARGARPQRSWEIRPAEPDANRWISTKEATKEFLQRLFDSLLHVPEQVIIGVPASTNEQWLTLYRAHLSEVLAELGKPNPQFFPEPFAVFQYYRHRENLLPPPSGTPLIVLVVDFGGGTFDTCIIETTESGNLAIGGSKARPIAVRSVLSAGKDIDRKLLELALRKIQHPALKKEIPQERIATRPWVLLAAEDLKIDLSTQMQDARLDDDCSHVKVEASYPAGWYHPEVPVTLSLTGEDLKRVIKDLWFSSKQGFGTAILGTIEGAQVRGGKHLPIEQIDYVILAGGSSSLPFLKELIGRTLTAQVRFDPVNILVGSNCEKAVAYGIAIEAAEERNRSLKTHDSMGPCIFNNLFLYSAPRRREPPIKPTIHLISGTQPVPFSPGTLLPGLLQIGDFTVEFDVKLPYRPHGSLFYWFSADSDADEPEFGRLNIEQDVIRVPPKADGAFRLKLDFDEKNGQITPTFVFGAETLQGKPFLFTGLKLAKEVKSFAGIDFGTSNSYAVALWAAPKQAQSRYPELRLSEQAGERLKELEAKLEKLRIDGVLNPDIARRISDEELSEFIFHSIKIEGNTLSRGETDKILAGKRVVDSKAAQEPVNVRNAYKFSVEHSDYLEKAPGSLIRELNKIILYNIEPRGGEMRTTTVRISGMDFQPPDPAEVPMLMEEFCDELRRGPGNKAVIQFAAEMHSKLTAIHPFVDGNGRTARLLMNSILVNSGTPAVVIHHGDKERYLDCLAGTNKGDISGFCIFLAECVESALEQRAQGESRTTEPDRPVPHAGGGPEPLKKWLPSEKLAEIMATRIARLPVDRKARYEAWAAGFESLREEFRSICLGFSEVYKDALYSASITPFDALPFEKYEALLRNTPAPKTWHFAVNLRSDKTAERLVFFFWHISPAFVSTVRRIRVGNLPPTEVTLTVSRRVAGVYQQLRDEPIRIREIAYSDGHWHWLTRGDRGTFSVESYSLGDGLNIFLQDAVTTFL